MLCPETSCKCPSESQSKSKYNHFVFRSFAGRIDEFAALSANDRDVLLSSNAPHFVQYVLARYFCADTGLEQGGGYSMASNFVLFRPFLSSFQSLF